MEVITDVYLFLEQCETWHECADLYQAAQTRQDYGSASARPARGGRNTILHLSQFDHPLVATPESLRLLVQRSHDQVVAETGMSPDGAQYFARQMLKD